MLLCVCRSCLCSSAGIFIISQSEHFRFEREFSLDFRNSAKEEIFHTLFIYTAVILSNLKSIGFRMAPLSDQNIIKL
ncbi:hypothetical protein GDO78_011500 [Eleutherodactylus coqui]|uniref:Uncharacterized protein n=1 Tax=Eleutherodactylus coqui TaxID=57060 RepID=A0A8J6K8K4_ELECQ|nr:hypothetical protein GDO78_011500 [Eleutherodactylus coqui]